MACACARDTNVKECCAACHVTNCGKMECPLMDEGCHFPEWRKRREEINTLPFTEPI